MTSQPTYRLPPPAIDADRAALLALQDLTDYAPLNPEYSTAALQARAEKLTQTEQIESRARRALDAARDQAIAAAWELHNAMLGAKAQVIAQYGSDSLAIQSIGLKKKSERKRPSRRRSAEA